MKRTIILISAWVIGFSVFAQLEIGKRNEQPNIPTWESYEFMKYGKVGASLYTGTINYSLPIYTYKDQDFELPITLEYATNGFRVNHSSGLLGHGWKLSCTGRITRKIRGIPDEIKFYGSFFQSGISYDGFSYLSDTLELYPQLVYKNEGQIYTGLYDEYDNRCYETEADEYSFDFCGYTGSFQRNRNNSIKDGQVFFIYDASDSSRGLMIQTEGSLNSSVPESFIITDINGYKYRFSVGEYILYRKDNSNPPNTEAIPISWNLDMIIAPNGRTISFNYSDIPNTKFGNRNDEIIHQNMSYYFMSAVCNNVPIGLQSSVNEVHNTHVYKNRLQGINICGNVFISFDTIQGAEEWYYTDTYNNSYSKAHVDLTRIKRIKVSTREGFLKVCSLFYSDKDSINQNGYCVSFLTNVDISGEGKYSFSYNNQNDIYPFLGTNEFDHWGFYNGPHKGFQIRNINNLDGYLRYDTVYNEINIGDAKSPSFLYSLYGTMNRISYPTGGYSIINYEPHDYSIEVCRRAAITPGMDTIYPIPRLDTLTIPKQVGGVRVKKIITYGASGDLLDSISYSYRYEDDSKSSGILVNSPRYGICYNLDTITENSHVIKVTKYYNLANYMYDYSQPHIEYSFIKESRSNRGHKLYRYSSSSEYIDDMSFENQNQMRRLPVATYGRLEDGRPHFFSYCPCSPLVELALTPVVSNQTKRGKLLNEYFFDENGLLLREKAYNYLFPFVETDTMLYITGEIAKEIYTPRYNVELSNTMITDYNGDIAISKTENYTYNNLGLPTSITTNTSDGSSLKTKLYYVCDSMTKSGVIADMAESHNLAQLLKKEQYKITNSNEKLVSAERLEYYHPDENNLALACPIAKYSWLNGQQWKLVESYQYDDKGNLIERTDTRGISESYLWGYKGCYPVARVNNSSFDDLNQLLNNSANTIRDTATLSDNKFIELKNLGSQQPNSLYSLYRYRTGVGLTEVVKPNLSTTTYQYNGYGKLTEIRDNGGHLIEQYDYNIITVEPLSASLECDTACYINRELTAVIACNGGSGLYSYRWAIIKANGDTSVVDSGTSIVLSPLDILIPSGQYCIIECTVHDIVSGESLTLTQSVYIKPSILCFENIEEIANLSNSSAIVTALIYSDNSVLACFCLERKGSTNCSVSIGNSSYSNFVNKTTDFFMQLYPGWNNVTLAVVNAVTADVELSIVSAEGHEIGQPNNISIQY